MRRRQAWGALAAGVASLMIAPAAAFADALAPPQQASLPPLAVGVGIALIALVALIALLVLFALRRQRRKAKEGRG